MQLSSTARPLIQALFDKTYLEQAVGSAPWGIEDGRCSYLAGCAIGRSLPDNLRRLIGGSVQGVLTTRFDESVSRRVRLALLGYENMPKLNHPDVRCLAEIQLAHDSCALNDNREAYRPQLLTVASRYELNVPGDAR